MNRFMNIAIGAALLLGSRSEALAQTRELPGDTLTVQATVESIEAASRTLTVKDAKGKFLPITVPKSMTRFSEIKVGDTISARYYDNVVLRLKPAGEAAVDTAAAAVTPGANGRTGAVQRTITATIAAIDMSVPSVTFKGENVKWDYTSRVNDKAALGKVKVGDRVDITWTEAVTVSLVSAAKK